MFTYPPDQIKEPVIYYLAQKFNVIPNIRRADIADDHAWAILELEGNDADIEAGLEYVRSLGVQVNQMEGDVITG
jgi:hypothetical protein